MRPNLPDLPVREVLPELSAALAANGSAVLAAPPGAGKTTLVPLHLLDEPWAASKRIVMLEPRRLAARASARQMARLIGEQVGRTVGYRTRLDTKVSDATRIEVVTEGIFNRMVLDDPELPGVCLVVFDEFHERSLDGDFGLALALDVQTALREDIKLLVMSATLDIERVAALLGNAPVIESSGRTFPVDIRYTERPAGEDVAAFMAQTIRGLVAKETGSLLAFLPGQAEIRRTAEALTDRLPANTVIAPLYGNLSGPEQDAAIQPADPGHRKVVLATSIAETSITIDGVRIVVDGGRQRLPVFEPSTGITRLETVRVSRASADQRAGRAGRTEPGIAVRLWRREQTDALDAFTPPQIVASDLSGFVLDSAAWGVSDPRMLSLIDPPPEKALSEASRLLQRLNALDASGALTGKGRQMRQLGLPVREAAMVIDAARTGDAETAAKLALLLGEQGLGGPSTDIDERLRRFETDKGARAKASRQLAQRIARTAGQRNQTAGEVPAGRLLATAFADRIAMRRGTTDRGRRTFSLANGRGAWLEEHDPLARCEFLVVADLTGKAVSQRILSAARLERADLDDLLADRIDESNEYRFDAGSRSVRARRVRKLQRLVLAEAAIAVSCGPETAHVLAQGVRSKGLAILPWNRESIQLRERVGWLRRHAGEPWPDLADAALLARLDIWFEPFQLQVSAIDRIDPAILLHGLKSLLAPALLAQLDRDAPTHFRTPAGSRLAIDYDGAEPALAVRVQELYGLKEHPSIGGGRLPLVLELLSPAQRPIQTTRDLPGFWQGSWRDVRADMRGRYPKHYWPDDPATAEPTTRTKTGMKR